MAIGFFVMDIFENTMKIMSVQAIPIQFPVILVHFTQKNCYLFRDSIITFANFFINTTIIIDYASSHYCYKVNDHEQSKTKVNALLIKYEGN
ncbi:hypothetical protein ACOQFO_05435, partial [Ureibacillus sp. MALMAid1270]|uniref:hypothetical protein n=1 Tax=Ureibacillus sp. MALMAid1270 TaxID=3411629 RepID=UPI003BA41789